MNSFAKQAVAAGGFLFLGAAVGLAGDQSTQPAAAPRPLPTMSSAAARPRKSPPDFFAGLTLTDDQKAKIEKIHQEEKAHEQAVINDSKLSPDVKDAMVQGYRRIENTQIFTALTPDQKKEVRKRVEDYRASVRQGRSQYPMRQLAPSTQQPATPPPAK